MLKLGKTNFDFFAHPDFRPHQKEGIESIQNAAKHRFPLLLSSPTGTGKTSMVLAGILGAMSKKEKLAVITRTHSQYRMFIKEFLNVRKKHPYLKFGLLVGRSNVCPMRAEYETCGFLRKNSTSRIRDGATLYDQSEIKQYTGTVPTNSKRAVCPYFINCMQTDQRKQTFNGESMALIEGQQTNPVPAEDFYNKCVSLPFPKCPYELLKSTLSSCDVMVLHYQYLLHPDVREPLMVSNWLGRGFENIHLVVDEAHNLAPYIREIGSHRFTRTDLLNAIELLHEGKLDDIPYFSIEDIKEKDDLILLLEDINLFLLKCFDSMNEFDLIRGKIDDALLPDESLSFDTDAIESLKSAAKKIELEFQDMKKNMVVPEDAFMPCICTIAKALDYLLLENPGRFIWSIGAEALAKNVGKTLEDKLNIEDFELSLQVSDIDPRDAVGYLADSFRSLTLISGTLSPTDLYKKLLFHDNREITCLTMPSPFPEKNCLSLCCSDATSQSSFRENPSNISSIEHVIESIFSVPGNIALFFTSYSMKKRFHSFCRSMCEKTGKKLMDESRDTNKQRFIELYKKHRNAALLGVCRGSFSEGVDFKGEAMNAVAVIGLPLAQWSSRQQKINQYYESLFGRGIGKEIAYYLPAVTASLQALGRCIRSPEDTGVLILADRRYAEGGVFGVKGLLPENLQETMAVVDSGELAPLIKARLDEWASVKKKSSDTKKEPQAQDMPASSSGLRDDLRVWRLKKSRKEKIPALSVFTDDVLEEFVKIRPRTVNDLLGIRGFGPMKVYRYAGELLLLISSHIPKQRSQPDFGARMDKKAIILETVLETKSRFGVGVICEILAGSRNKSLIEKKLNTHRHYAKLAHLSQTRVKAEIDEALQMGFLKKSRGLYPKLGITDKGRDYLES